MVAGAMDVVRSSMQVVVGFGSEQKMAELLLQADKSFRQRRFLTISGFSAIDFLKTDIDFDSQILAGTRAIHLVARTKNEL